MSIISNIILHGGSYFLHQIFPYFQAYHSSLSDADTKLVGNMALLPLKTQFKGPAPKESERHVFY